jgi:predicted Ser/Thr protein kinase
MTPAVWLQIKAIVQEALERAPDARAAFVAEACAADEELRGEVESLLRAHARAGDFIESPLAPAVPMLGELLRAIDDGRVFRDPPSAVARQFSNYHVGRDFRGTDRFTVLKEVGAGGMGVVYAVHDRVRDEVVALKTLRHAGAGDIYRLKHEFRRLTDIAHPNLVCLYELTVEEGLCFFTMELVDGVRLTEYVQGAGERAAERVRSILPQLVAAVLALHRNGKLHRDIKPSNIMVTPEGRVVVLDFGLVSDILADGVRMNDSMAGTPAYLAPELRDRADPSEASDWYSMGVTIYEALTGHYPIDGSVIGSELEADLGDICAGLLDRDPDCRLTGAAVLQRLGLDPVLPADLRLAQQRWRGEAPFVGRTRELEILAASFTAAGNGRATAVYVHGPSGIGKTALVQRFLDQIERRDDVIVLRGRCYEHESVPYKALDGIIDSLSAYLNASPPSLVEALVPPGIGALGRAFPVMLQVDRVARMPRSESENVEPSAQRRLAVSALRELLTRFATSQTLVLYIDDLHWADADSVLLLEEVFQPPPPPRLLLLASFRTEEIATKPFLQTVTHLGGFTGSVVVPLAAMTEGESRQLIASLIPADVPLDYTRIERQAEGNPFLLEQLAHYAAAPERGATPNPALADVLDDSLRRMPAGAGDFLDALAVCGKPMEPRVLQGAAGLAGDERPLVAMLRSGHFLRASGSASHVELYHDRIREVLAARLSEDDSRRIHRRLADTLTARGIDDPEALFEHYRGAGERDLASLHAAAAARKAFAAFAFDRAALFYRSALEMAPGAAPAVTWREGLAEALTNAGRPGDAAGMYLEAAREGDRARQIDLQRRAAEQLLIGGHIDRGMAVIDTVLRAVNMRLARGPLSAFASLSWRRARLRWRGLGFVERQPAKVPAQQLLRIDACWSVTTGLAMVDSIRAADFNARHLSLALDAGEPYRIARALALEGGFLAMGGIDMRFASRCLDEATRLARRLEHPHALAVSDLSKGMTAVLAADWKTAVEHFERARVLLRERCTGATWETNLVESLLLGALLFQGEIREVSERLPALLVSAKDRGNLYFETELRTRMNLVWLSADQPDEGERTANEAMESWSHQGFHRQHYNHVLARIQTELYRGRADAAWDLVTSNWPAFEHTRLLNIRFVKVETWYLRARAALLMAASSTDRSRFLASARADARRLKRVKMPWSSALALLVEAAAEHLEGSEDAARARLAMAAAAFESIHMKLYVAVAHRRLGELQRGKNGQELVRQADEWMAMQGIKNPALMTQLMAPGFLT